MTPPITALFLDIGGVLLTNGWDGGMRRRAADRFGLDPAEMERRHRLAVDAFEAGRLSLDDYLARLVFDAERPFTPADFKAVMFAQSQPFPEMIALMEGLKAAHRLRVIAVNNEGRELNVHRIGTFRLAELIDAFLSSCFVHLRKPDPEIFRLALDVAQTPAAQIAYVDDRAPYVEAAERFGIRGVHHTGYASTRAALAGLGLAPAG
ncbi:MAG TPA: HAD family phosphatase [bacterium]|nr:HAD family phosphatase [bacterium]